MTGSGDIQNGWILSGQPSYTLICWTSARCSCSTTVPIPFHHVALQDGSLTEAKSSYRKKEVHCLYKVLDKEREHVLFYSYRIINVENVGRNTLAPVHVVWSLYLVVRASFSNSFLFLYQLIHLVFLQSLVICLFVSTCFGPIGPSSGGSNA